jgi:hypothetical protein
VGENYWEGLIGWIKETMLSKEKNISQKDLHLINIVNSPKEAVVIIDEFYNKYTLKPNF